MQLTHQNLKERQRVERSNYPESLGLRVHRALSWLNRSEKEFDDQDARFIFLWISFNSAYANEIHDVRLFTEQDTFQGFINKLCDLDKAGALDDLVWKEFTSTIRLLLSNKFVFSSFWDFQRGLKTEEEWKAEFNAAKASANRALSKKETSKVLAIVFARLYMLRNQMLHGGATWDSRVNVDQKRDSVNFLGKFVPAIIKIMMDNPQELWGAPHFPVIKD